MIQKWYHFELLLTEEELEKLKKYLVKKFKHYLVKEK